MVRRKIPLTQTELEKLDFSSDGSLVDPELAPSVEKRKSLGFTSSEDEEEVININEILNDL